MLSSRRVLAGLLAVACAAFALPAAASAFFGWQVADVPPSDVLNVRAYPSNGSRVLVGYPNGTPLSLTGRCVGLSLDAINGQPHAQQREAVRSRWCEVVIEAPATGAVQTGWVYGRYIRPL